jgi:hypothetical protein
VGVGVRSPIDTSDMENLRLLARRDMSPAFRGAARIGRADETRNTAMGAA